MGIVIHIEVQQTITTILQIKKNKKTKKLAKTTGKLASTEFKSFDSLFIIRPRGTRSKNQFKDENNKLLIIDSWIIRDIFGLEQAKTNALMNANNPQKTPNIAQYPTKYPVRPSEKFQVQILNQILKQVLKISQPNMLIKTAKTHSFPPL